MESRETARAASTPEAAAAPAPAEAPARRSTGLRRRGGRAGAAGLGTVYVVLKSGLGVIVSHHPIRLVVLAVPMLIGGVLRPRPRLVALGAAILVAVIVSSSLAAVAGIAIGVFVLLMTLFVAIGTILRAREHPTRAA